MTTTTTRKFGVEFEAMGLTVQGAADVLTAAGVSLAIPRGHGSTSENARGIWKVEYDGSIGSSGFEAVTPPSTSFESIATACRALTRAGAHVTRACGTHVHVDARDLGIEGFRRLAKIWLSIERAMECLVSASRVSNHFCQSARPRFRGALSAAFALIDDAHSVDKIIALMQENRYAKLNLQAFWKHGTVEFRLHQGTLNAAKIERWARLCVRIVNLAAANQWTFTAGELDLYATLREIFRARTWDVVRSSATTAMAPTIAQSPAHAPRAGSKRETLWALFNLHPTLTVSALATMAEEVGFTRKYATDQHWHWRRAQSFATTPAAVATVPVTAETDSQEDMNDEISYFTERAQDLSAVVA